MMLKEVADYLAASPNSQGTVNTDIFYAHIPGGSGIPDSLICLYEYAGAPPILSRPAVERPGLQVVARGPDTAVATVRAKLEAVEDKLRGMTNTSLGGVPYLSIVPLGSAFGMGMENKRVKFAQNYRAIRARSEV